MSSARVPGSLRGLGGAQRDQAKAAAAPKKDSKTATLVTAAALLTAAAPVSVVMAQGTLPPVTVEAGQTKKKAATKAPAAAKKAEPAAGQTDAAAGPPAKDASPYADPNSPYKVDKSGSGKLTEPLVNTPKSITAIPKEVIQDKAATSIRELARSTPGVTLGFGEGGNAFGDRIFIRGFDARGDIYVNGMRDPGNTSREVFALEQVEIYKGPGGSIGGRGTPGGAVNLITKLPSENYDFYNVSTMFGTDSTFRSTVDVNQVLAPWLAVRGNIMYQDGMVPGRDFVEDDRWGGFFAATIRPSSDFKLTLDYYRLRTDGMSDFGIPANPITKKPWGEHGLPGSTFYGNLDVDFMKNSSDVFSAASELKLAPGLTLASRTRFGQNITDYIVSNPTQSKDLYDLDPTKASVGNPNRYQVSDFVANQTDLTARFTTGSWHHTVVAGVEVSREEVSRSGYTISGVTWDEVPGTGMGKTGTQVSLFDPQNHRGGTAVRSANPTFTGGIDTVAAYLLDTIKLNEQWSINGGIRIDHFDKTQTNYNASGTATGTFNRQDNPFTYHAGIVYKPAPNGSIYAAIATAASPAGSELDSNSPTYGGLDVNAANLAPETATGIEIGTKWELFNRRLLATAALFQTEKTNAREVVGGVVDDTGAFRVRGIDLGVQGRITREWSVYGGFVWMDTEVIKSAVGTNVGLDLANVPTMQFSLLTKYRLTDKLTVGAQAVYANELKGGTLAANTGYETPAYWRFDALAEYKFSENFSANLNVLNLTDEVYYDAVYQSASPFVHVAPGRAGYLTLNWKY